MLVKEAPGVCSRIVYTCVAVSLMYGVTSLALECLYEYSSVSELTLKTMGKIEP